MEKIESITKLTEEELISLGLKSGLEIHQQLEGHKLFCSCPTKIRDDEPDFVITRKLRASIGELGEVDSAALLEQNKEKEFHYEGYNNTTCLVELDEIPPQKINELALKTALSIGKIFNMTFPDTIKFMRKTVIDGSNTSGFQRTALIATDGLLQKDSPIHIESVCLEEDSCKNVEDTKKHKKYNLSRLGIPLIEIATGPDLKNPTEIKETAEFIGMILRSFPNVKRGLGTIRQDINVSIRDGVRVEIKGAQDLKLIPTYVEFEAIRQKNTINLFEELKKRKAKVSKKVVDLSETLQNCNSKVIRSGLEKQNGCVLGIRLEQFAGLVGFEVQPGRRFGSELSDHAKTVGVKGLFHSDELPNYGITEREKEFIYEALNCDVKQDAFIIIADTKLVAEKAMKLVIERASDFNIRKCVRNARPDGTSSYMRPMSGSSRMYPETDIKSIKVDLKNIEIPKLLSEQIEELKTKFNLTEDICKRLIREDINIFELVKAYENVKASYMVDYYFSLPSLIKKKHNLDVNVREFDKELFSKLNKNEISKDAIIEILVKLVSKESVDYESYKPLSIEDVEEDIKKIILENKHLARGAVMGKIMNKYNGKVDGAEINKLVSKLM